MNFENVEQCPICHDRNFIFSKQLKDFSISEESFTIYQCQTCDLLITTPRPATSDIGVYYQSKKYISHARQITSFVGLLYQLSQFFTIRWKFRLIKSYLSNNLLLDVGCGAGHFLAYAAKQNVAVIGVEISPTARGLAKDKKLAVFESLSKLPDTQFSVITLWHVLEHLHQPEDTLQILKKKLTPSGIILLAVPNWKSYDGQHYQQHWAGYDVPRHLWHFHIESIHRFLRQAGLTLVTTLPMKLDAYYVSLLSERYKNNRKLSILGGFKALYIGWLSNIKSRKNLSYSSNIYIAQNAT